MVARAEARAGAKVNKPSEPAPREFKRGQHGYFVEGTAPGPGRPKGTTGIHQVPRNLHVLSATWPRAGGLLTEDDRGDPIAITHLVLEQLVRGIVARSAA